MAGLLYRRILITLCAMAFVCHSAYCYDSSFPFPFEFGHSSDIYLNVKKPIKNENAETQKANEILEARGISKAPSEVKKYIKNNEADKIKLLIKAGFNVNNFLEADYPVYYAVKYNSFDVLKVLLDNGADPNKNMNSVLRTAILKGNKNCARLLVEKGAKLDYYDQFSGEYVLYTALKKRNYELAKLMLEKGAEMDKKSYFLIKNKKLDAKYGIYVD